MLLLFNQELYVVVFYFADRNTHFYTNVRENRKDNKD